ncbi:MAG: 16S rRNA (cytosine(1402)-N(4))-methyltransferase RsmH [Candidatus Hydrogenedentes bacterium]|nr:16S rRNA (cytosine(1402)-N(4))-methyltransferase RsmH [Candidatus Hydrogenedentota bacterium]
MSKDFHIPVMVEEVLALLDVKENGVYVDATIGAGGHSEKILSQLKNGILIGIDIDPEAIKISSERFRDDKRVRLFNANYSDIEKVLNEVGVEEVDGILIDAGLSSFALDDPKRGFSFQVDGPLDMRMNPSFNFTAYDLLFSVDEKILTKILKDYGDVPKPRKVAKTIIKRRVEGKLSGVLDLVEAIREAYSTLKKIPEETRQVFQAIRIAVNDELNSLKKCLIKGFNKLKVGGRFAVITFHSGEDRIVKSFFMMVSHHRKLETKDGRLISVIEPVAKLLTPKPIVPSNDEIYRNPRAKSAKLRAIEKIRMEKYSFDEVGGIWNG